MAEPISNNRNGLIDFLRLTNFFRPFLLRPLDTIATNAQMDTNTPGATDEFVPASLNPNLTSKSPIKCHRAYDSHIPQSRQRYSPGIPTSLLKIKPPVLLHNTNNSRPTSIELTDIVPPGIIASDLSQLLQKVFVEAERLAKKEGNEFKFEFKFYEGIKIQEKELAKLKGENKSDTEQKTKIEISERVLSKVTPVLINVLTDSNLESNPRLIETTLQLDKEIENEGNKLNSLYVHLKSASDNSEKEKINQEIQITKGVIDRLNRFKLQYFKFLNTDSKSHVYLDRAIYNLTKNKTVFAKYLPIRKDLADAGSEKLTVYEKLVSDISNKANILYRTQAYYHGDDFLLNNVNGAEVPDPSTKYMVGALITELFFNRPDLVNNILNRNKKLTIITAKEIADDKDISGFHNGYNNLVVVTKMWEQLLKDLTKENEFFSHRKDNYEESNVIHEIIHLVDGSGKYNSTDGIPSGMTKEQEKIFLEERHKMYERYSDPKLSSEEATLGIDPYAFHVYDSEKDGKTNLIEFPPVTMTTFLYNPHLLQKANRRLYDLYVQYFNFDPVKLKANMFDENALLASKDKQEEVKKVLEKLEQGSKLTVVMANGKTYECFCEVRWLNAQSIIVRLKDNSIKELKINSIESIKINGKSDFKWEYGLEYKLRELAKGKKITLNLKNEHSCTIEFEGLVKKGVTGYTAGKNLLRVDILDVANVKIHDEGDNTPLSDFRSELVKKVEKIPIGSPITLIEHSGRRVLGEKIFISGMSSNEIGFRSARSGYEWRASLDTGYKDVLVGHHKGDAPPEYKKYEWAPLFEKVLKMKTGDKVTIKFKNGYKDGSQITGCIKNLPEDNEAALKLDIPDMNSLDTIFPFWAIEDIKLVGEKELQPGTKQLR